MTEHPTERVCPDCGNSELLFQSTQCGTGRDVETSLEIYCGECGRQADDYSDWEERPARLPDRISAFLAGLWGK